MVNTIDANATKIDFIDEDNKNMPLVELKICLVELFPKRFMFMFTKRNMPASNTLFPKRYTKVIVELVMGM